jgi:hypothetical protein
VERYRDKRTHETRRRSQQPGSLPPAQMPLGEAEPAG